MSYILDALTKSQTERQRRTVPTLTTSYALGPTRARGRKPWLAVGLGTVGAIVVLAVYALMRPLPSFESSRETTVGATPDAPLSAAKTAERISPAVPASPEKSAAIRSPKHPETRSVKPSVEVSATPVSARATRSERPTWAAATETTEQPPPSSTAVTDAPSEKPPIALSTAQSVSPETMRLTKELLALKREADLAEETSSAPEQKPSNDEVYAATAPEAESTTAAPETDGMETIPQATDAATTRTTSAPAKDMLTIEELPADMQTALLPLTVNAHAYAQNPRQRMIIVNMKRYREGDRMREGPLVEAITPSGAVLVHEQRRFELPVR